jgi:hypothetical protein
MKLIMRSIFLLIIIIAVSIGFLFIYIKQRKENYKIISILIILFNIIVLFEFKNYFFDAFYKETVKVIGVFKGYYGTGMNYLTTKQIYVYLPEKGETIDLKIDVFDKNYKDLVIGNSYLFEYYENTFIIDSISNN